MSAAQILAAEDQREQETREAHEVYSATIAAAYAAFEDARAAALNTLRDATADAEREYNTALARIARKERA